jgi:tight adherence protein B
VQALAPALALLVLAAMLWRPPVPRRRLHETRRLSGAAPGAASVSGPRGSAGPPRVTATTVAALADRLAAAVEAGLPLPSAWRHATGSSNPWRVASADPVDAGAAAGLAAALHLAEDRGLPPGDVLRVVAEAARDLRAADSARAAATAGPMAAARIVAALPLGGPVVAALLGVDPLDVLLGTAWGRVCLVGGIGFVAVGAWWSHRLVLRARDEARAGT